MTKRACWTAGVLLCGYALAGPALAGEPVRIRVGWVTAPAQFTPVLFEKKEILRHYGKTYVMEPMHFRGSPPQITALAARELEVAALAPSSLASTVQNARLDIRVIADVFQDGAPGKFSITYGVRADSPVRTVADLKGKTLATNAIGGAVDVAARVMLRKHGLDDKRDVNIVEVRFPAMEATLREGKVEAVTLTQPFYHAAMARGGIRPLFTMRDAMGISQMIFWTARADFIAQHREALVDFLEDTIRALRWYTDARNRDEAVAIVARLTKQKPEDLRPWLLTEQDFYRDPNAMPNLEALQRNLDILREVGFLKERFEVRPYADVSLVEAARARLK